VRSGESLLRHTPTRTGGVCPLWVVVHRRSSLIPTLERLKETDRGWAAFGACTRTMVRDGGLSTAALRLGHEFSGIEVRATETSNEDTARWTVGASTPLPMLARKMADHGYEVPDGWAGDPGTLGGLWSVRDPSENQALLHFVESVEGVHSGKYRWQPAEKTSKKARLVTAFTIRMRLKEPAVLWEEAFLSSVGDYTEWFRGPGELETRRAMLRRTLMSGTRLRGVLLPSDAPELLVNVGEGTSQDYWELQKSVLTRVEQYFGVRWSTRLKWKGLK